MHRWIINIMVSMENIEINRTALYQNIENTVREILKNNIDDIIKPVMSLFEPFIKEHLNGYKELEKLKSEISAPVTLVVKNSDLYKK